MRPVLRVRRTSVHVPALQSTQEGRQDPQLLERGGEPPLQRHVLYLGEINASQREAWRKTIEVQDAGTRRQVALFPAGRVPVDDVDAIGVRLSELRLQRSRQSGACWLALQLWQQLELDNFWRPRRSRAQGNTPWLKVLKALGAYRLIDPGSEWRLHRQWFDTSAMADLLDSDFCLAEKNTLYRCLDRLFEHKDALFEFLARRWGELFGASLDVLLYDLTSTYFETDEDPGSDDLRQLGYSRDKRGDCRQVVIALIVAPEGFPLSYEVMGGGTADSTTLGGFLDRIEHRYGRANCIWVMDRGIPTEDSLAKMRSIDESYLVGTPKGRLTKLEQAFLKQPWAKVRDGVQVKRLATEEDVYVLAHSDARIDKERCMRRKRLRRYIERLKALQGQSLTRDQLLMMLGAAKHDAGRAAGLVKVTWPKEAPGTASLEFSLDRERLRQVRRREGRYLLCTNLTGQQPETLWIFYIQLTEVEQAYTEIKHDLAIRPIFHKTEERIKAHIFVAFLAYCLQVTLKAKLRTVASGTTPREIIARFRTMQMVDVTLPTTDGRELTLSRYTQPEPEHRMLLDQLRLSLPGQPPPKITAAQARERTAELVM